MKSPDRLTCQCRHSMPEHERNGKCKKCPCTVFALIYGSYSDEAKEVVADYFTHVSNGWEIADDE